MNGKGFYSVAFAALSLYFNFHYFVVAVGDSALTSDSPKENAIELEGTVYSDLGVTYGLAGDRSLEYRGGTKFTPSNGEREDHLADGKGLTKDIDGASSTVARAEPASTDNGNGEKSKVFRVKKTVELLIDSPPRTRVTGSKSKDAETSTKTAADDDKQQTKTIDDTDKIAETVVQDGTKLIGPYGYEMYVASPTSEINEQGSELEATKRGVNGPEIEPAQMVDEGYSADEKSNVSVVNASSTEAAKPSTPISITRRKHQYPKYMRRRKSRSNEGVRYYGYFTRLSGGSRPLKSRRRKSLKGSSTNYKYNIERMSKDDPDELKSGSSPVLPIAYKRIEEDEDSYAGQQVKEESVSDDTNETSKQKTWLGGTRARIYEPSSARPNFLEEDAVADDADDFSLYEIDDIDELKGADEVLLNEDGEINPLTQTSENSPNERQESEVSNGMAPRNLRSRKNKANKGAAKKVRKNKTKTVAKKPAEKPMKAPRKPTKSRESKKAAAKKSGRKAERKGRKEARRAKREAAKAKKVDKKKRLERERAEKENLENQNRENERKEQERLERERAEKENLENQNRENERKEQERLERERAEKENLENQNRENERKEQERLERERAEKENLENQNRENERKEQERLERERAEKENLENQNRENERKEQERLERERAEKENLENQNRENERKEQERLEREITEKENLENQNRENEELYNEVEEEEEDEFDEETDDTADDEEENDNVESCRL
ncbi:hypothetical protein BgAZ_502710 [Babesia gibsoni]|uniref:Uncharacterized protein n=1 Tax=Babesia gibsoni TaxID=33632 RepID=A0AAD8LJF3_BABGI|nr:hypothetical protein BgAZ_502710 [Babesia gibsoni]